MKYIVPAAVLTIFTICFVPLSAHAQEFCAASLAQDDADLTGDRSLSGRTCWQTFVSWAWRAYDMETRDWDEGFGYRRVCDPNSPLARTMNAIYLLHYTWDPANPAPNDDRSGSFLAWGGAFAVSNTSTLVGRCGTGGVRASTRRRPLGGSEFTQLYMPFFYGGGRGPTGAYVGGKTLGNSAVARAGTLIHEARHHNGAGHSDSNACRRAASCDERWADRGANYYHVVWLWWYFFEKRGGTTAWYDYAHDYAASILNTAFNEGTPSVGFPNAP